MPILQGDSASYHALRFLDIFLLSSLFCVLLTPLSRQLAFRLGVLDHPKAHGIHTEAVPRLGGLAIYLAFVIGALYRMDLSEMLKGVLVASTLVFMIGVLDDWLHVRAAVKLLCQLLACGIMMFKYGVILDVFPHIVLNAFFTALGVIGLTNAINFLDNMDGLAAGLVAISSFTIFTVSFLTRQFWLSYLSVALGGAAVGFLIFNLRKAHVFMGDAGSTFLGFTLASLAVMAEWSYHWSVTLAVPILILGVPILDMILITVLRIKEDKVRNLRQWIEYAGKDHLSHRFMRLGLGTRSAVFSLWVLQAFFSIVALAVLPHGPVIGILGLVFFFVVTFGLIFFFRKRRKIILSLNRRSPAKRRSGREKVLSGTGSHREVHGAPRVTK